MYRFRNTAAGVLAAAALAACSDAPAGPSNQTLIPQAAPSAAVDQVVPGQVLVKFKDPNAAVSAARSLGTPIQQEGYKHAFSIVTVGAGQERAEAARLAADPRVEWAEPNYIRHVETIDSRLWAFFNPGGLNMSFYNDPNGSTGPIPASYASKADADEDAIEGIAAGGGDVVIGSIDTGVDFDHPEFTGRLIAGCDWFSQAAAGNGSGTCTDFTPFDTPDEGHGTHTTGTMAGTTVGVAGVTGASSHVKV
ncbi:MAG TPA: S8 family serine peptidase, partial [Longimicrobium sp.]